MRQRNGGEDAHLLTCSAVAISKSKEAASWSLRCFCCIWYCGRREEGGGEPCIVGLRLHTTTHSYRLGVAVHGRGDALLQAQGLGLLMRLLCLPEQVSFFGGGPGEERGLGQGKREG